METTTARRFMLEETWKKINNQKLISINDLSELMDQVHKLLMNYDDAVKSRDKWKNKYMENKK